MHRVALIVIVLGAIAASGFFAPRLIAQPMEDGMKQDWLIVLHPTRDTFPGDATPEEISMVQRHFQRLVQLKEEGVVVLAGRTMDESAMGLVVLRGVTREKATDVLEGDPAVAGGVMTGELRPYGIAIFAGAS